jgi:hypothetical protein
MPHSFKIDTRDGRRRDKYRFAAEGRTELQEWFAVLSTSLNSTDDEKQEAKETGEEEKEQGVAEQEGEREGIEEEEQEEEQEEAEKGPPPKSEFELMLENETFEKYFKMLKVCAHSCVHSCASYSLHTLTSTHPN